MREEHIKPSVHQVASLLGSVKLGFSVSFFSSPFVVFWLLFFFQVKGKEED